MKLQDNDGSVLVCARNVLADSQERIAMLNDEVNTKRAEVASLEASCAKLQRLISALQENFEGSK